LVVSAKDTVYTDTYNLKFKKTMQMNYSCQTFYEEQNLQYKWVNVQLHLSPQFVKSKILKPSTVSQVNAQIPAWGD